MLKKHLKRQSIIKDIVLAVTYQCNGHCRFCNIWQSKKSFSCQPSDYRNLSRSLESININGGEPFLRADLPKIVRTISRQCPKAKIIISTNGFLPSVIKKTMVEIIKFKRDIGVAVSLDGFGRVHEELRGFTGGFCLAIETVRLLKELGVRDLKIAFTLNNRNINQGVEFSLAACHNSPHYFQKEDNRINKIDAIKKEIKWLIEQELKRFSLKRWGRAYFAWGLIKFLEDKQRVLPDYSGMSSVFIDPFGNIYPSDVWDLKIGRLNEIKDLHSASSNEGSQIKSWLVGFKKKVFQKRKKTKRFGFQQKGLFYKRFQAKNSLCL